MVKHNTRCYIHSLSLVHLSYIITHWGHVRQVSIFLQSVSIRSNIPLPPRKQFSRIYGILSVLLIFFGQLNGFLKLGFSSTGVLWSGLSILHHFVIIRRGLLAKQQVMLPCSKSCWIAADRQEERRGKQVGPVYRWWDRWSTEVSVWPLKSFWDSSWGVRRSVIVHHLRNWGRRVSHIQAAEVHRGCYG